MRLLHTESSNGWGGQEIRILKESIGMRERGHEVIFAVVKGGKLAEKARAEGFPVYEIDFKRSKTLKALLQLISILRKEAIDLVNTHSSLDAWLGGVAARICGKKIIRTRHLSTAIRPGLNSRLLYNKLADFVVTTSSAIIPMITGQARISEERCRCIATGIDPNALQPDPASVIRFREALGIGSDSFLVGTACVVRSWKGVGDLIRAAQLLPDIHVAIIGGGYLDGPKQLVRELGLTERVHFTGHLESPYAAIASLDLFTLLSTSHEGISQALLQAAYLERPLIATRIGGSPEVCLDGKTGILVDPHAPEQVAHAITFLKQAHDVRKKMGRHAKMMAASQFTLTHTLDEMENVYRRLLHEMELVQ